MEGTHIQSDEWTFDWTDKEKDATEIVRSIGKDRVFVAFGGNTRVAVARDIITLAEESVALIGPAPAAAPSPAPAQRRWPGGPMPSRRQRRRGPRAARAPAYCAAAAFSDFALSNRRMIKREAARLARGAAAAPQRCRAALAPAGGSAPRAPPPHRFIIS
ncbi:unnamed protein product, partial [Iphiclides podalirius]